MPAGSVQRRLLRRHPLCQRAARCFPPPKQLGQKPACITPLHLGDFFRRSGCDDLAPPITAFRAKVDHPVRRLDDLQVVLDDRHRVAIVNQFMEHVEQLGHIVEMQSRRRFVKDVERPSGRAAREFFGKLDALGFAA